MASASFYSVTHPSLLSRDELDISKWLIFQTFVFDHPLIFFFLVYYDVLLFFFVFSSLILTLFWMFDLSRIFFFGGVMMMLSSLFLFFTLIKKWFWIYFTNLSKILSLYVLLNYCLILILIFSCRCQDLKVVVCISPVQDFRSSQHHQWVPLKPDGKELWKQF